MGKNAFQLTFTSKGLVENLDFYTHPAVTRCLNLPTPPILEILLK